MYQTGGTIKETIELMQRHEYVLPAIQREFVWKPEQIQRLFDSLMQGYPFGTFLLWRVHAENSNRYKFYDFVREYHERDNPHCPPLPAQTNQVTAVLDGQQRLTALNIGLCGSMAIKLPNRWWNNPDAFPIRHLYLDLIAPATSDEEGDKYRFEFLTGQQYAQADSETTCWFKVGDILTMESGPDMLAWINEKLPQEKTTGAFRMLDRLYRVVHTNKVVAYYEEKSQDLTTVLNIFIRMNSGGTVLSYSDLLLSIAVAQWARLDARKEIHTLVDELNKTGENFSFSQDLVLKAGLLLTNIGSVGFKVENFNHENMVILENRWPDVKRALQLTVRLLASFGFNGRNLRAASAILPIAYYLCQLNPGDGYLIKSAYMEDRSAIRSWLTKSILKSSGIWGSGLDTLLTALRETITAHGQNNFPVNELETVMARRGKSLAFEEEELDELVELKYGGNRTFALLTLLFPFVDCRNHFHVDHIFPHANFTKSRLRKFGLSEDDVEAYLGMRDGLANLQLLEGLVNIEKQQTMPAEWLRKMFPDQQKRDHYSAQHFLGHVPEEMQEFAAFYMQRKQLLRERIGQLLQRKGMDATPGDSTSVSASENPSL